jgi:tRNA-Thr(GGU) m(6)t(6)A37 methyltransferase TsaA
MTDIAPRRVDIVFHAVGRVRRDVREPNAPQDIETLRATPARIVIEKAYADALLGVEPGSDLLVLTYLDRATRDVLSVHPRGDSTRPIRGVFATRSPDRPNPIGVTSVRVLAVEGLSLEVTGLDAVGGTPVLDLKSHSESFDSPYRAGGV